MLRHLLTLVMRVFCGYTLLLSAVCTSSILGNQSIEIWLSFSRITQTSIFRLPLSALLGALSVWLILGIRTRSIALYTVVLFAGLMMIRLAGPGLAPRHLEWWELIHIYLFFAALIGLVGTGGGQSALSGNEQLPWVARRHRQRGLVSQATVAPRSPRKSRSVSDGKKNKQIEGAARRKP